MATSNGGPLAVVTGASFNYTTGFTQAKLESTASYQAKNLQGIALAANVLEGFPHPFHGLARGHEPALQVQQVAHE